MELPTHVLMMYGYVLLFAWVLVEQLGIPLPATPVLLAAGALSVDGPISFWLALAAGVSACLIADSTWFLIGRRHGHYVLRILCKLSLEPTTCVRRTQDSFGRRRGVMLMFAKFVPGLAMLAAAGGGAERHGVRRRSCFLTVSASTLWVGALLAVGRFFGDVLKRNPYLLDWAGRFSGALLLLGILAFFLGRVYRRRMVLKKLAASRLEPVELKSLLDSGETVFIVDLRHPLELLAEPFKLPGALHFSPESLAARHHEIPRDERWCSTAPAPARPPRPKPPCNCTSWASCGCAPCAAATMSGKSWASRWMRFRR